jgi:hypothetical protein
MSDRNLTWNKELMIVRDVLRWADTTAETNPSAFRFVLERNWKVGDPQKWRARAWWLHPSGRGDIRFAAGEGTRPEAAIVELADTLRRAHGFHFPAMPEEAAR